MGRSIINGLAALAAAGLHAPLYAQPIDEAAIEVQGDRALSQDEIIRGQRHLYLNPLPFSTAPRFYDPICIAVAGLADGQNELVAERIRANIRTAGIALADAGCKPNALVSANRRPGSVINALRIRDPQLFNRESEKAIRRQLAVGEAAISWGETTLRANDGMLFGERSTASLNPAFAMPVYLGALPSRLRAPLFRTKVNAIVFYDLDQLEDVSIDQLGDHATLHLLGDPQDPADPEAAGVPSILSLFVDGPRKAPPEMTSLDRAYLRGLYQMKSSDWAWRLTASMLASYENPTAVNGSDHGNREGALNPS